MSRAADWSSADLVPFLLCQTLAAILRLGYLAAYADGGQTAGPLQVADPPPTVPVVAGVKPRGQDNPTEFDELVHHERFDGAFTCRAPFAEQPEVTAHVAPAYPWLLGQAGRLSFLPDPPDRWLRWGQAVLGSVTVGLYYLFARVAFRSKLVAGLVGFLCAINPAWVVEPATLSEGPLAAFLLALCLFSGMRGGTEGGVVHALFVGAGLAGLVLLRAAYLPFALATLAWYLWRCRMVVREGRWLNFAAALVVFLAALAPWVVRDYQEFGRPLPVADSAGLHLFEGAGPGATGGPRTEEAMLAALASARGEDAAALRKRLAELPQPDRYNDLGRAALDSIRDDPAAYLNQRLTATAGFLLGDDWRATQRTWRGDLPGGDGAQGWLAGHLGLVFLGFLVGTLALALLGWRWSFAFHFDSMPLTFALVLVPLPYVLTHAQALPGPRLPLDGALLTLAAFALAALTPKVGPRLIAEGEMGRPN
jgi:4-amino-4-deoxy-L-arabinose transferase-like glycosyltransferase